MRIERYTPGEIRAAVEADRERLFAHYAVGRPSGWIPDPATRDLVATGRWLDEELRRLGVGDADRKTQNWYYNRWTRSDGDYAKVAAGALNTVLDGAVEQGRVNLRRWG